VSRLAMGLLAATIGWTQPAPATPPLDPGVGDVALAQSEEPRSISYGCTGGFSGGGGGVTVRSDGTILRWSLEGYWASPEESFVRSDPAAAKQLFARVDAMDFTSIELKESDNLTCHMTQRHGASTHTVTWAYGDSSVPSRVAALASEMERLAPAPEAK
jgi:hypothetical protein